MSWNRKKITDHLSIKPLGYEQNAKRSFDKFDHIILKQGFIEHEAKNCLILLKN